MRSGSEQAGRRPREGSLGRLTVVLAAGVLGTLAAVPATVLAGEAAIESGHTAGTAPLSLREAQMRAVASQPLLEGLASRARAAREMSIAARELPDPEVGIGIAEVPVQGGSAWSLVDEADTQLRFGFIQAFPRAQKRRLRGELGERDAERLDAEQTALQREIGRDVALAWLDVWRQERAVALAREALAAATLQLEALAIASASGSARQSDVLAARVEASRLGDGVAGSAQDVAHARNALSRWIGAEAQRPLADALPTLPQPPPVAIALARVRQHPHLDAIAAGVLVAQTGAAAARADYAPDYRVALAYGRRDHFDDLLSVEVSMPVPLFRRNRQDRRLAAALADEDAALAALADARRLHEAAARLALDDVAHLTRRLDAYDSTLLPQAEARVEAALIDWASGRGSLHDVLEARRAVLDVRRARLDLQHDRARHAAELAWLGVFEEEDAAGGATDTGVDVEDVDTDADAGVGNAMAKGGR